MPNDMANDIEQLRSFILSLHDRIRDDVVDACERQSVDLLSKAVGRDESDTIYAIDRVSEETVVAGLREWAEEHAPVILIAEGISDDGMTLPESASEEDAPYRIIIDPIDGTRGLMYQKRSAWILTGVAPNRGDETRLQDIELSVMTEIPLVKQHLSDQGWAMRGSGAHWERYDRLSGRRTKVRLGASTATTLEHGFSTIFRPFPGGRDVSAAIDDQLVKEVAGADVLPRAYCFEDQYTSTGGQMYELAAGHDRFIADIRPLLSRIQETRDEEALMCAHPYDVCAWLVAAEAGIELIGLDGEALDAPLNTTADVGWIGYANAELRAKVERVLVRLLRERGLIA